MKYFTSILLFLVTQAGFAQSYTELCEAGKKHLDSGEYKKAAEYFLRTSNAAESKSEKRYTLTNLGYAQRMYGKTEDAAASYAKALAMDTTSIPLLTQRGNILLELDSAEQAIECYDKILARHPDREDILRFRAYAHTQTGEFKEGKEEYLKLISQNSNDNEARLGLALLYEKEGSINESLIPVPTFVGQAVK